MTVRKATPASRAIERLDRMAQRVVATPRPYQVPEDSPGAGGQINMQLTMADMRVVALTAFRDRLMAAKSQAEAELAAASSTYRNTVTALEAALQAQINAYPIEPEALTLMTALTNWTGRRYTVKLEGPDASYYSQKDKDPVVDTTRRVLRGEIHIYSLNASGTTANYAINELDKALELPFSPEAVRTIEAVDAAKADCDRGRKALNDVHRMIAELPHMGDRVQQMLIKAHLRGQLKSTEDILTVTESAVAHFVLPPAVQRLLPPPEPEVNVKG